MAETNLGEEAEDDHEEYRLGEPLAEKLLEYAGELDALLEAIVARHTAHRVGQECCRQGGGSADADECQAGHDPASLLKDHGEGEHSWPADVVDYEDDAAPQ